MVQSFMGELTADQAAKISMAMQETGPFRPDNLVQGRNELAGWNLYHQRVDGSFALLCESNDRWPVPHHRVHDAETWAGKNIEADDARISQAQHQRGMVDNVVAMPSQSQPDPRVAPIRPGTVVGTNYPVPEVVEMFERFYEQAKRGEISGAAIALARPNGAFAIDWASGNARIAQMVGAASMLQFRMQRRLAEAMDGEEGGGPDAG